MRRALANIRPTLHLARVSSAFGAVANVWFVILWTHAHIGQDPAPIAYSRLPMPLLLAAGAVFAIGLYAFGAALNDLLDTRRDRALRPSRPIPSGQTSPQTAAGVVAGSLLVALAGASAFGGLASLVAVGVASGVLAFHLLGKFIPGVGFVILTAVYGAHMLVPNPMLGAMIPVWIVMTHAMVAAWAQHVIARRTPTVSFRAAIAAVLGWLGISALIWLRHLDASANALPPREIFPVGQLITAGVLAMACVAWCAYRASRTGPGARAAEKIGKYAGLWLPAYGCAWLFGEGFAAEGWILAAMTFGGALGLSLLRDMYNLLENPAGWRRE